MPGMITKADIIYEINIRKIVLIVIFFFQVPLIPLLRTVPCIQT